MTTQTEDHRHMEVLAAMEARQLADHPHLPAQNVAFLHIIWISTGNYLLGLRNDSTIWKCNAPAVTPLVWSQVYP